ADFIYELVNYDTIFFFSSRRRHTRSKRDWSSDVCSSDLEFSDRAEKYIVKDGNKLIIGTGDLDDGYSHQIKKGENWIGSYDSNEIGRASCRERVWIAVGAVGLRKRKREERRREERWNRTH